MILPFFVMRAIPFILISLGIVFALRPHVGRDDLTVRALIYWVAAVSLVFTISSLAVVFGLLAVVLLAVRPKDPVSQAALFPAVLLAVPGSYKFLVPFPGVNYLIAFGHFLLIVLVLLLPAGLRLISRERTGTPRRSAVDGWVFAFFALCVLLNLRGTQTVTNSLRAVFEYGVYFVIPYLVITRAPRSWADVDRMMQGLFAAATMLVGVGFIAMLQNWNHFTTLASLNAAMVDSSFRGGLFRISGPLSSGDYGFWMAVAVGLGLCLRKRFTTPPALAWLFMGIAFALVFAAQSRGALLAAIVMVLGYLFFRLRSSFARVAYVVGGALVVGIGYVSLSASGFGAVDAYGTFDYRQQLLEAAAVQMRIAPLFGSPDYYESPVFAHLVQGQGIVDFVNGFVIIALRYGYVGLALYIGLLTAAWLGVVKAVGRIDTSTPEGKLRRSYGVLLGVALPALLTLSFTTSFVSYIQPTIFLFVALMAGYAHVARTAPVEVEAGAEQGSATDPASEPAAKAAGDAEAPTATPKVPEAPEDTSEPDWLPGYVPGRTGWPT